MTYPYLLYGEKIRHAPVFRGLRGDPFVMNLSPENSYLDEIDSRDQKRLQEYIERKMASVYKWGVSGYLERRDTLLRDCPQMVSENRFYHLGIDIIVPCGTPLHAPLDGVVAESGYEPGEGNYGGFVLLRHDPAEGEAFYSFYGHLARDLLPPAGLRLSAGDEFARIGDFHENGNWFHHTHMQVITGLGYRRGYLSKGYCSPEDMVDINSLCPDPVPLFKR